MLGLCGKLDLGMYLHNHTQPKSTLSHVGRVEKNAYAIPEQTMKNNAEAKSSFLLKQSCGRIKTVTPTQRGKKEQVF